MNDIKPSTKSNPKTSENATKTSKPPTRIIVMVVGILAAIALLASVAYLFMQNQELRNDPAKAEAIKVEKLVEKVEKLMALPNDETPTVATIEDKDKLNDQPFFHKAENGDKILIYTAVRQAIIYRPGEHKIINAGPIAINSQQPIEEQNSRD